MVHTGLEELFDRFRREGDLDALAEVFDRTAAKLLKVARHLSQDESQAEDVVQATFLAAIEGRDGFDASRELVPWLTGILTHKAKVARALLQRIPDPDRLPKPAIQDPVVDAELRDLRSTLDRALERVPDAYREVLRLHLRDGKDAEEIALELHRPAGTVRVQLHRGLKHLRRGLPASIALAGLGFAIDPRGLAAIRAEILGHAGSVAAATAGTAVASATAGGMLMGKKVALVIGVAVIASGLAWFGTRSRPAANSEPSVPTAEKVALSAPPEEVLPPTPPSERVQASPVADSSPGIREPYGSLEMEWTWADSTPAAGIGVGAASRGEPDFYDHAVFGTTDGNGRITFERLREGKISVYTSRDTGSEKRESTVTGGQRTSERFSIPNAEDIYGLVLDTDGHPVSGAEIHISPQIDDGGSVEARSSQAGSYFVRAVPKTTALFATAEGRGSSLLTRLRDLDPEGKGEIELDLVLQGESSALRGSVLDPDGRGVANAWVTLHPRPTRDKRGRLDWPAVWTASEAGGSFRLVGVHAGHADLEVFASGFAVCVKEVDLEQDQTLDLVVRLEEGFTIRGTARTIDGAPVGRARVEYGPTLGSDAYRSWRHGIRTWANEDGAYVLVQVPQGEVDLRAELRSAGSAMRDSTHRTGRAGDVLTWDPVLKEGLQIRGRIADETGSPLEAWTIGAMPESGRPGQLIPNAKSDAQGAFLIPDCSEGSYTLRAYPPKTTIGQIARVTEKGVQAGASVVLTAPHAWDSAAWLIGKIADENGVPLRDANIQARHRESGQSASSRTIDAEGAFKVGPLPPGHFTLYVSPTSLPEMIVPVAEEVLPSEVRDVGTIRARPRGSLELQLTMSDGSPVEGPFIVLNDGTYGHPIESADGNRFKSEELYVGTYSLVVNGARIATLEQQVEIRAGETTHCALTATAGQIQDIRFVTPEGVPPLERLSVLVRNADGSKVLEEEASFARKKDGMMVRMCRGGFAPGRYTFEAVSPEGWTTSGAFEVLDLTTQSPPIEAPLRKR